MSSNGLNQIRSVIDRGNQTLLEDPGELEGRMCPSCSRRYSKSAGLIVCKFDSTLLVPHKRNDFWLDENDDACLANGRYKIQKYVGEGDLHYVYFAFDKATAMDVAIKVLKPQLIRSNNDVHHFVESLRRESNLQHPNIVKILNFGTEEAKQLWRIFVVTERFAASQNLKTILNQTGPMPPNVVLPIMRQVCSTLKYAASQNCLHEDLKASNLYVSLNDEQVSVKVSDFGVSKPLFNEFEAQNFGNRSESATSHPRGDIAYLAPEVASGGVLSEKAQIYSFGCVMYEAFSGKPPFGSDSPAALLQHRNSSPKSFAEELGVSTEIETIVMRCLSKNEFERFENFEEVGVALAAVTGSGQKLK